MTKTKNRKEQTKLLVLGAILTAVVIILQLLGAFSRIGPCSISLVLIPIVIGAAMCGVGIATWLGLVFGAVVLLSGDATAFLQLSVFGTVVTVLLKGALAGFLAGITFKVFNKINFYLAVLLTAIVCPVVNTGVFILGCFVFFFKDLAAWAPAGQSTVAYIFLGLVGGNFIFEVLSNIILSPVITRVLNLTKK